MPTLRTRRVLRDCGGKSLTETGFGDRLGAALVGGHSMCHSESETIVKFQSLGRNLAVVCGQQQKRGITDHSD